MRLDVEPEVYGMCGCGRVLYKVMKDGKQIGVTHTPEDEDHHLEFWRNATPEDLV